MRDSSSSWALLSALPLLACVSFLEAGLVVQEDAQPSPARDSPCSPWEVTPGCSEGQTVEVNGISLYYEVHGDGEPLLLLHGGGSVAENFNPMLPTLSKHFRVITPDTRAHGRSTDTSEPLSYRQMTDDMIALLDSLDIESVVVGGFSDGASIAIHLAIYYPDRIRALLVLPVDLEEDGLLDTYWETHSESDYPAKLVTWWKMRKAPAEHELAAIRAPTLFVIGEEEPYVKSDHLKWQYESIPNAQVVWIPGAGHALPVEKPHELTQAFLSFLEKHQ